MKYKVKELYKRRVTLDTISSLIGHLRHLDSDKTQQTLIIRVNDAQCIQGIVDEYNALLEELINAAEVVL